MLGTPALFAGASAVAGLAGCSGASSNSTPPALTPVETPADRPRQLTPMPVSTPTPDTVPTETPRPTITPEPEEADEQVLIVAREAPDPNEYGIPSESTCAGIPLTLSGLMRVSPEFEIEPDWAESWEPHEDGARWLFRIRENADGWARDLPVRAQDFVRAWQRVLDPENGSPLAWLLFDIENARDVALGELPPEDLGLRATDDWTLEVQLQRPRFSFPALAAMPLLAPFTGASGESSSDDLASADLCPSNGPFRLENSDDDGYVLVLNGSYWNADAASLERIEVRHLSAGRDLNEFRQERVDFMRVDDADLSRARADVNFSDNLETGLATRLWCLVPQIDFPAFEDVRVRRALGKMIDRRRLEQIVEGRVSSATTLFPDGFLSELDAESPNVEIGFDIDGALEEIAETPYADPFVWPEIRLTVPEGNPTREQIAQDVAAQLYENLGINVGVDVVEPAEFDEGMRERRFPLAWVEWTYRYLDPACGYSDLFASWLHPNRPIVWEDEEYDELVRLADSLADVDARAEVYARCEEFLQEQGVYIPLVYPIEHYLVQPWVLNMPTNSRGQLIQPGPIFSGFPTSLTIAERPDAE